MNITTLNRCSRLIGGGAPPAPSPFSYIELSQDRTVNYRKKLDLTGKTAFITGATGGIGASIVEALCQFGAKVIVSDLDEERVDDLVQKLTKDGHSAVGLTLEITDSAAVQSAHDSVLADHGPVGILVNCAGIALSNIDAEEMSDERWLKVLDVNLNGTYWMCRTFGASMLKAGSGSIVNIGSMSGFIVNKPQGQAHYNASKAAVHHLTRSLAAEWAPRGVRVNAVAPTYIDTELNSLVKNDPEMYGAWLDGTPMNRMGNPDEVASVVAFLSSDAASLMTGSIVSVDGGYVCW